MTEIERFEKLKERGYTYNPETGDLISGEGHKIERKNDTGRFNCAWLDASRSIQQRFQLDAAFGRRKLNQC